MRGAEPSLLGIVLAGGESRRYGSPKPLAVFRGEELWRRAVRVLAQGGAPALVVANAPEVVAAVDPSVAEVRGDLRPDAGPLAGIETGLSLARDRGLAGIAVLACDLVLVEAGMIRTLISTWPGYGVAAFDAPGPWGCAPLCSIWGCDLLPSVADALTAGRGSVGETLLGLPRVSVDLGAEHPGADPARVFRSTNRPEDLAALETGATPS